MSFSPDKIAAACQGRDARKGGLNVPELKQYVVAQGLVTNAGPLRRPQLIALICSAAAIPVPVAVKQKLPTKKAAAVKRVKRKTYYDPYYQFTIYQYVDMDSSDWYVKYAIKELSPFFRSVGKWDAEGAWRLTG